jgi:F-type H+-transporting ATPase subunit delta
MKMTGFSQLAARYVTALYDIAVREGAVEAVERDLQALAALLSERPEVARMLANPLLGRDQLAKALDAAFAKAGLHALTLRFLTTLAHGKRLMALPAIAQQFVVRAQRERGELAAQVVSATPLSKEALAAINSALSKKLGRKMQLAAAVDASLLGGVVLRMGSLQLDGSLAGTLERLGQKLKGVS